MRAVFLFLFLTLLAGPAPVQQALAQQAPPCAAFNPDNEQAPYDCSCTAAAESGPVWGTDVYTSDSHVCTAARHAGLLEQGAANVRVTPAPGRPSYAGSTRQGVTTQSYADYGRSFTVAAGGSTVAACPTNMAGVRGNDITMRCACPATPSDGPVWGTDVYTSDSNVCLAARHAGALPAGGGEVTVAMAPGQPAYTGTRRNGVVTQAFAAWRASFRFPDAQAALPICPNSLLGRPGSAGPLRCLCPAEDVAGASRDGSQHNVWGTDIYSNDSAICTAALHYGAVPLTGGAVTLLPRPGQASYEASIRNRVRALAFGAFSESYTFEGEPRGDRSEAAAEPVAAPVAEALNARGQVALYIRFRTDSAELDAGATPALEELRDALRATPALRIRLVGHTDSTGQAARNRTLSQQRAQSVMRWLVAQGIAANRLATDGKGPDEPLADNATEAGRAINRRTQAIRM